MTNHWLDSCDPLAERLKAAAAASRPTFSPELHQRILASLENKPASSLSYGERSLSGSALRGVALAAGLAGLIAGAWLGMGWSWEPVGNANTQVATSVMEEVHADLMPPLDQWAYYDADPTAAAEWYVDELPLDLGLSDTP